MINLYNCMIVSIGVKAKKLKTISFMEDLFKKQNHIFALVQSGAYYYYVREIEPDDYFCYDYFCYENGKDKLYNPDKIVGTVVEDYEFKDEEQE